MKYELTEELMRAVDRLCNEAMSMTVATPARVTEQAEVLEISVQKVRSILFNAPRIEEAPK